MKAKEADCWWYPGLEAKRLRGANPNSRKSKLWDGRKKGRSLQRSRVMWLKEGTPSSCPPTPWRALREGELPRCSSDFKLEERCSSSRRAPLPRPRPAPRCLKFVYFSTGRETNCGFWNRLNTFLGEGLKWWKCEVEPNFVHHYFLLPVDSFAIHHSFLGGSLGIQNLWQRVKINYSLWGPSIKFSITLALNWPPTYSSNWVFIYAVS